MARPVERLFQIDEMIRGGEYPSVEMFMQRFDIEKRTIFGDLLYLKKRFYAPIAYSRKHGGYYYVLRDWSLATQAVTPLPEIDDDKWLWSEIATRFGKQEADSLYRDFLEHRSGKPVRLCRKCHKSLPQNVKRQQRYHDECSPRFKQKQG